MRLAVLYSGGKDSNLALMKAKEEHEIACLISIVSENRHSYMFHTPNIDITLLQSQAMGIPLIRVKTKGEKEAELQDLKKAILEAKQRYKVEGIITGAVKSTYQASRVQKICHEIDLWAFNPLWQKNEIELLDELLDFKIKAIISGVFAEPLDESYLGKEIDKDMIAKLMKIAEEYKISPAGEGGEIETTVINAPFFKKRIEITKSTKEYENYAGFFDINDARLEEK